MLMLVIPDYCVLMGVAHTPIILIWAPFGWPPGVSILNAFYWPVVNQFVRIAAELFVSVGTGETHLDNFYRKLGARSRTQAVARARDLKLI